MYTVWAGAELGRKLEEGEAYDMLKKRETCGLEMGELRTRLELLLQLVDLERKT